jgi:hypothetical protein
MSWQDILKVKPHLSASQKDLEEAEVFAVWISDLLDIGTYQSKKHIEEFDRWARNNAIKNTGSYNPSYKIMEDYDLNNPSDVIELSKTGYDFFKGFGTYHMDFNNPAQVTHFLKTMKLKGYDMEAFKSKGLLTQGSSKTSPQKQNYTNRIKETIKVLRNMNKPITEETIMYELDMEEGDWDDKYNELIQ